MTEPIPVEGVQTPTTRTLKVTWAPSAVTGAVERVSAVTHSATDPDAVYADGHGGHVTWNDLACLVDIAHAFLADDAPEVDRG